MTSQKEKHDKFIELAEKRVSKLLHQLKLIGNLSNRSTYNYAEEEIMKIFSSIDREIKRIKSLFKIPEYEKFSLKE